MTSASDPRLHELLALTVNELAGKLYEESGATTFGSKEPTPREKEARGRILFDEFISSFKHSICGNNALMAAATSEKTELVSALADVVIGLKGGVPALVVSVMAVKIGLQTICDGYTKP